MPNGALYLHGFILVSDNNQLRTIGNVIYDKITDKDYTTPSNINQDEIEMTDTNTNLNHIHYSIERK